MKYLVVLLLLLVAAVSSAQIVLKNAETGEFRVVNEAEWENSGITVEGEARAYVKHFFEVTENPGVPFTVKEDKEFIEIVSVFKKRVKVDKTQIVYNSSSKVISLTSANEEKEMPTHFILFAIISIVCRIGASIAGAQDDEADGCMSMVLGIISVVTAFLAFIATGIVTLVPGVINNYTIAFFIPLVAAVFAVISIVKENDEDDDEDESERNHIFSVLYYIAMAGYFVVLFV